MDDDSNNPLLRHTSVPLSVSGRPGGNDVGTLLRRISDDLRAIARDEGALGRAELGRTMRAIAAEAAAIVLGGVVALLGFALLCLAVVPALEPLIEPLWLRLVVVAGLYIAIGCGVAAWFAKRLQRDAKPRFDEVTREAKRTIQTIREGLRHG